MGTLQSSDPHPTTLIPDSTGASVETATRTRPAYTTVGAFGLLLIGLAPALMFVIGLSTGLDLDDAMIFVIGAIVPFIAAGLVWRFGTWAKVVGVVVVGLALMGFFWMAFGLAYPASFGDFTPAVMMVVGVIMALFGCVAAIIKRRAMVRTASKGERRLVMGGTTLVLLAAVVSAGLWGVSRSSADASAAEVTAELHDFAFVEGSYEVTTGQTLGVHNSDGFVHDFTVHELDIAETLLPGEDAVIDVPDQPGTYTIYCTLHSDPAATDATDGDMVATLVVR